MMGDHTNAKSFRGSSMSEWQCATRIPSPMSYSHSPLCKILMSLEGEGGSQIFWYVALYDVSFLWKERYEGMNFWAMFLWMTFTEWGTLEMTGPLEAVCSWAIDSLFLQASVYGCNMLAPQLYKLHVSVHNWSSHACLCYARVSLSCSLLNIWRQSLK